MSLPYYVWRCPECKRQLYYEFEDLICPEHGNSFEEPERIEVVVPEEGLTDEMVERADAVYHNPPAFPLRGPLEDMRRALIAAGPWTRKLDREKMIEIVESFNPGWTSSEGWNSEAIVDALLEETA